jgi:hypothetical protein
MVPGVQDPNNSPRAFRKAGGRSWSPVGWQDRYSHGTVGMAAGLGNMTMGPKAPMTSFQNPMAVPTV